jgi:NAD/NADP transhydrogenase beta subunit
MKSQDTLVLILFGFVFWAVGTLFYRLRGPMIFESNPARYWINFVLTPLISAALCILVLKLRHIPPSDWANAALLIAIPGMFGEAILLSSFTRWMPILSPATGSRYGAFLFATYAVVLTICEAAALRA